MDVQAFRDEAISFTDMMAKNARLDEPLPAGQDFSEAEDKELQTQLRAMDILPREAKSIMWAAFCAKHVGKLANNLRELSVETQPKAFSTYVQILSLLPEAAEEPYYRIFLSSPDSRLLANLVGNAFSRSILWRSPSGPGFICGLLIELLFWCDTSRYSQTCGEEDRVYQIAQQFPYLPVTQKADIERLDVEPIAAATKDVLKNPLQDVQDAGASNIVERSVRPSIGRMGTKFAALPTSDTGVGRQLMSIFV
ncbi:MYND Zn-finger protein [Rhizoctonia solani]|uniref:MYND Zn-finger protein n=1 Tax=Rhizoctonia solani TaxID=456999 RepID=A0A8H8P1R0_9AGAM|nr:MYND Zn-finger protein [Rhizoctonia solani]QRW22770.1 MYND Zn-finger protein [Rhizoctonia solani]